MVLIYESICLKGEVWLVLLDLARTKKAKSIQDALAQGRPNGVWQDIRAI